MVLGILVAGRITVAKDGRKGKGEGMKAWLCMNPPKMTLFGVEMALPDDTVAMLSVYRTKTAARKVHGSDAVLMEVVVTPQKKAKA